MQYTCLFLPFCSTLVCSFLINHDWAQSSSSPCWWHLGRNFISFPHHRTFHISLYGIYKLFLSWNFGSKQGFDAFFSYQVFFTSWIWPSQTRAGHDIWCRNITHTCRQPGPRVIFKWLNTALFTFLNLSSVSRKILSGSVCWPSTVWCIYIVRPKMEELICYRFKSLLKLF